MTAIDVIVTAGGTPAPGELLYEQTQGKPKALLDLAGQPMIQWVLDALSAAESVRSVVVIGLPADTPLKCARPLDFLPEQGGMLENAIGGVKRVLELNPAAQHVLSVSSDIPLLTPAAVDWVIPAALQTDHELYYPVITRDAMERRFPASRRSYVPLKDGVFCGGDMQLALASIVQHLPPAFRAILEARKNALRQASLIGFDVLLRLALRRATVDYMERMCLERLGLRGRALICPHAEVGMDVDKPHQYELARRELEARR